MTKKSDAIPACSPTRTREHSVLVRDDSDNWPQFNTFGLWNDRRKYAGKRIVSIRKLCDGKGNYRMRFWLEDDLIPLVVPIAVPTAMQRRIAQVVAPGNGKQTLWTTRDVIGDLRASYSRRLAGEVGKVLKAIGYESLRLARLLRDNDPMCSVFFHPDDFPDGIKPKDARTIYRQQARDRRPRVTSVRREKVAVSASKASL